MKKLEADDTLLELLWTWTTLMTVFRANTPTQAEYQLHRLVLATRGINLHVNAYKMEYICVHQREDIFTLSGGSLKLVDMFPHLGSCVSSMTSIDD